jgi:hypothetical protein
MQRREFVVATGSLLAAGLPEAATLPRPPAIVTPPRGLKTLGSASFTPLLNQNFNVYENRHGVTVQLTAVKKLPTPTGGEQFTLTFTAPAGVLLGSGMYDVEHAAIGLVPMYLEQAPQGQLLAHFNLLA